MVGILTQLRLGKSLPGEFRTNKKEYKKRQKRSNRTIRNLPPPGGGIGSNPPPTNSTPKVLCTHRLAQLPEVVRGSEGRERAFLAAPGGVPSAPSRGTLNPVSARGTPSGPGSEP